MSQHPKHTAGVDWGAVNKYVSTKECYEHYKDPTAAPKPSKRKWYKPWSLFREEPKYAPALTAS